jgi:hypothetical protein
VIAGPALGSKLVAATIATLVAGLATAFAFG